MICHLDNRTLRKGSEKKMKNKTKQNNKQPTKITKNRIIALLLALLLVTTVLSPIIPVKAQETTVDGVDMTENNAEGGGHQTGAGGDGETSGGRPTGNDASFSTYTHYKTINGAGQHVDAEMTYSFYLEGDGHFNVRSVDLYVPDTERHDYKVFVFSDKPFNIKITELVIRNGETYVNNDYVNKVQSSPRSFGGSSYYYNELSVAAIVKGELLALNLPNLKTYTVDSPVMTLDVAKKIENTLDLTKDDYKEPSETSAVYNKVLDFASISADYKVKYTIEKNKDGHFEFITPDDAGIQFDWINRTDIDGAYVKFTLYGEYYDSFWSTTYTNTYVTLTCDRKNDLTYLCKQKDMLLQAKEKCNGSKGYGFVVNYIYVQAFARIDGTLCRSRIYKFDSDLVSDYGNADSENDEWFPEITGGDSMPEEYEPDPENPDPEKTEPKPDKDDDTVVDTPIDNDPDVIINDDVTYLEAFKQFINVMKQGISYLGDFPALVAKVFSFIPPIFILFIGIGFAVALLLRFLGR